ncbi:hypothetical protein VP01_2791g1 [Puccinia sorghi]|uniref:Uncharacterized protein n=1 Tax=Puccinia sorghi TaxID=27349 RepID=A0A0L6V4E7_9BASI|nr:hypothetical protein VP01_2791g1 [Puccinia sorghi]
MPDSLRNAREQGASNGIGHSLVVSLSRSGMAGDHPDNLRSRAQQRMSRINRRISGLPVPAISNFSKRIHGMTWQAYVSTATGYILLANLKPHPAFLTQIEIGLFILNMMVFFLTTSLLAVQLVLYPRQFKRVAFDPNKNSFIPTSVLVLLVQVFLLLSCGKNFLIYLGISPSATLIVGTVNYVSLCTRSFCYHPIAAGIADTFLLQALNTELRTLLQRCVHCPDHMVFLTKKSSVFGPFTDRLHDSRYAFTLFWLAEQGAVIHPCLGIFCSLFLHSAWAFPVFPLLLSGVVTFNVLRIVPLSDPMAVSIFVTGLLMFGAGAFMCLFYLAIFLLRIMTTGFLDGHQVGSQKSKWSLYCRRATRNSTFCYRAPLILFNMGKIASKLFPLHSLISPNAGEIVFVSSLSESPRIFLLIMGCIFVGIMLTGCSAVLFVMAAIPYWTRLHKHLNEILGCWATTFPTIGLILSLKFLGDTFDSKVFYAFQTTLTIMIFCVYLIVLCLTILAVWKGLILMSDDKAVYMDSMGFSDEKMDLMEKNGGGTAAASDHKH